ncbi:hypothetical protein QA641_12575 [Bradyrhizobium sp. CB1650]|uniref:hypothetical protein n=1 Tax=Bradyrhizobium sp. CB1650 TaxID=3039153 RepID=UPI00243562B1|nr:hypothetical protein [Bradyrhizobium sp. CB1650]WGD54663.1 hypothetical protein QA641_12575 [Bradyrhizobium sp. CB1650]
MRTGSCKAPLLTLTLSIPLLYGTICTSALALERRATVSDFSSAHRGGAGHASGHARTAGAQRNNIKQRNNVNVRRDVNVNVNKRTTVVARRPVRGWVPRPYYGTIVGGSAFGTIVAATTVGVAPVAPAANMCWFWTDAAMSQGYWDYCVAP